MTSRPFARGSGAAISVLLCALAMIAAPAFARLPPPPPMDPKAAEEKAAKDKAAAEKTKADQARYEDKAVANFQSNMRKAGKPVPKPTPIVVAAAPAPATATATKAAPAAAKK